jgi:UDP-N-acetylglucosamine--N-acetylmuramyl-(pentapeptide) pyrophosphoryl-undecaprenol N-acetylglucosamine transferase
MRVIIAGGGTGGHLFPGIALAEEIQRRGGNDVLFVGTSRGLEAKVVPREGYALETIDVSGLKRAGAGGFLRGMTRLPRAFVQSRRILRRFRPDLVVGVGGYSSGPMVLAAAMAGTPTAILEQNSIPGVTNRMLGKVVRQAFLTFEHSKRYFPARKSALAGNPIRTRLRGVPPAPATPCILVVGGSQGAQALNELVPAAAAWMLAQGRVVPRIVHQSGEPDLAATLQRYAALALPPDRVEVKPFIDDMATAYGAATIVVCRAGATTIAELTALGRPAIFIPFPFAADDHQYWNAKALADAGAARVHRQGEVTGEELGAELAALLDEPSQLATMRDRMLALGRPQAARDIVDALESMVPGGARVSRS